LARPRWEEFPDGLRHDVEEYLTGLKKIRRISNGHRIRPCRAATIAALLHPDVIEPLIEAYWQKNGDEPSTSTIDFGAQIFRIARETRCLDQAALQRLDENRATLETIDNLD
jgi:hypothetical protein